MNMDTSAIEEAFHAQIKKISPLTERWGLDIVFQESADLARVIRPKIPSARALHNSKIVELADRHGVLRLSNIFTGSVVNNFHVTQGHAYDGTLSQDWFHRDQIARLSCSGATLLYKDINVSRAASTFYAQTEDVRQAVRQFNTDRLIRRAIEAIEAVCSESYGHTSLGDEFHIKMVLQSDIPDDFTTQIFRQIPAERRFEQVWNAGEDFAVIHSNIRGGVLHARPSSGDPSNPLLSAYILP